MVRLLAKLMTAVALLGLAAGGIAAAKGTREATSPWPLRTDGQRYAAWIPTPGTLKLKDFDSGTSRSIAVEQGCTVADGRSGYFLINCSSAAGESTPFVLDARRRVVHTVPASYDPRVESFGQVGRYWLGGTNDGNGHTAVEYLNWRSGRS